MKFKIYNGGDEKSCLKLMSSLERSLEDIGTQIVQAIVYPPEYRELAELIYNDPLAKQITLLDHVEELMIRIVEKSLQFGFCILITAAELEIDSESMAIPEAVNKCWQLSSLAIWIVAYSTLLPEKVTPFEVVWQGNERALLRHEQAIAGGRFSEDGRPKKEF